MPLRILRWNWDPSRHRWVPINILAFYFNFLLSFNMAHSMNSLHIPVYIFRENWDNTNTNQDNPFSYIGWAVFLFKPIQNHNFPHVTYLKYLYQKKESVFKYMTDIGKCQIFLLWIPQLSTDMLKYTDTTFVPNLILVLFTKRFSILVQRL